MAALQHTYGDPATSYNITALHIVDAGIADHIFLQGAGNFIKDSITAIHVVDTGVADSTFLQGAGNFIKDSITAVHVIDTGSADHIFLKGGVSSQFAETTAADPESWE